MRLISLIYPGRVYPGCDRCTIPRGVYPGCDRCTIPRGIPRVVYGSRKEVYPGWYMGAGRRYTRVYATLCTTRYTYQGIPTLYTPGYTTILLRSLLYMV